MKNSLDEDLLIDKNKKTVIAQRRIDTTGIVKGYTVDIASEYLKKEGYENFVVDAGGDMYARGRNKNGEKWKIGIEGLNSNDVMLTLQDEAIATSGISRKQWQLGEKRVHHLINPKDPENFSHEIKTVTVIEDKAVEADGRAKSLFLMGVGEGIEFANKNNIKALFLDYKGTIYVSEKIKENLL
jgi:FAD:protein FMN transferase